jgi:hypothetical protein
VLSASTSGTPGWRRARRRLVGLTEDGGVAQAASGGGGGGALVIDGGWLGLLQHRRRKARVRLREIEAGVVRKPS